VRGFGGGDELVGLLGRPDAGVESVDPERAEFGSGSGRAAGSEAVQRNEEYEKKLGNCRTAELPN
jgi:hypothetical protein